MTGRAATEAELGALLAKSAMPPIGQVIRSAENYLEQALAVLGRDIDPASLGGVDPVQVRRALLSAAGFVGFARTVLATLARDGALAPVGSAVRVPGSWQITETDGPRTAGTDGALNTNTDLEHGDD